MAEVKLSRPSPETTDQIERAENVQVLIAIAIISGYLTLRGGSNKIFENFPIVINILSFVSLLFLTGKLITLTLRPFYTNKWLREADQRILPSMFVIIFVISFSIILPEFVPATVFAAIQFTPKSFQMILNSLGASDAYIFFWTLVSILAAWQYASWTTETMSHLETATPNVRINFTSGPRGESFPLTLKNPHREEIPPKHVQIEIKSDPDIDVDIPQAKKLNEGAWQPRLAIPASDSLNMHVQITRPDEVENISEESVEITTKYLGRVQKKHVVELEG